MRISYLAEGQLPSRAAHCAQILHMTDALASLGHDVTLLAPWHRGRARGSEGRTRLHRDFALEGRFTLRYVPYLEIGGRLGGSLFVVLAAVAAALRPDLVYTRSARTAALAARLRLPVVLESHAPPGSPRARRAMSELVRSPQLRRWVFISERLRQLVDQEVAVPADRAIIAHDAVDLGRFPAVDSTPELRRELGVSADAFALVHAGHMYAGRGVEHLLEIAARRPAWQVLLLGGTPADIARIEADVAARGLGNVRLFGHRPQREVARYLAIADVLLMPYTSGTTVSDGVTRTIEYASPMKLFEYLAAARPIVATRWPAIAEVLRDGENALLVAPDSTDALLAALDRLAASPGLGRQLAASARETAALHTWRDRAARICEGLG